MQKDELILVTGAAGFIGFHTVKYLIKNGYKVIGVDNLNDYYDVNLKVSRLKQLQKMEQKELFVPKLNIKLGKLIPQTN